MKLIPASRAPAMMRPDVGSSVWPPNIIVPRQSGETFRPDRPSLRYSMALSCEARSGRQTGDRERETLGARHQGIQLQIFVRRMRLAADRPDRADRRAADACG